MCNLRATMCKCGARFFFVLFSFFAGNEASQALLVVPRPQRETVEVDNRGRGAVVIIWSADGKMGGTGKEEAAGFEFLIKQQSQN